MAQVNLGYTEIRAPGEGIVGERQVRPGQLLSPGAQILTFVADTRWVRPAYTAQTQLTHIGLAILRRSALTFIPGRCGRDMSANLLQRVDRNSRCFLPITPPETSRRSFSACP